MEIAQAEALIEEMERLDKEFITLIKPNEGHGFRKEENRIELYTMMEAFLAENLE